MRLSRTHATGLAAAVILASVAAAVWWLIDPRSSAGALTELRLPRLDTPDVEVSPEELFVEPVVLNFWASWCVACREEHAVLMTLEDRLGAPVYGINFRDQSEDARRWIEFYGDPYRFSLSDFDGRLGERLDVAALPVTLLVDVNGDISFRHDGPLDAATVANAMQPLLVAPR